MELTGVKGKSDFSENYSSSTVRGILSRNTNIIVAKNLTGEAEHSGSLERTYPLTKKNFTGLLPVQWSYMGGKMKISTTVENLGLNTTFDSCSTSLSWSSTPNLKFASWIHMPFVCSLSWWQSFVYITSLPSLLHRKCPYKKHSPINLNRK